MVLAPQAAIASRSLSRSLAQGPPIANRSFFPGARVNADLPPIGAGVDCGDLKQMGLACSEHFCSSQFAKPPGLIPSQ